MIGYKVNKPNYFAPEQITWANNNNAIVVDKGDFYEIEEKIIDNKSLMAFEIQVLKRYLFDTDYKIIKAIETGSDISDDIKQKRQQTRDKINELEKQLKEI